jgi:glycosyltransferase involved in cell wall biosynthesis
MEPLVSVNITTYNRAHLLPRCLDSILKQSYENMEINIADDCSTDETFEVVKCYQERDKRIRYFRHDTNLGNAQARNTALENCNGKFVAFMDDDDEWIDKNKIKKQVGIFLNSKNKKIGIICTSVRLFSDGYRYKDKIVQRPINLKAHILSRNGIIYSPTVMTTRDIMLTMGGFDDKMSRGVDSEFYRTCIVKYDINVHFMPEVTTAIHEYGDDRITPKGTMSSIKSTIYANVYLLMKYKFYFIRYPRAVWHRLRVIVVACKEVAKLKFS